MVVIRKWLNFDEHNFSETSASVPDFAIKTGTYGYIIGLRGKHESCR